jgi:hypothetical protein
MVRKVAFIIRRDEKPMFFGRLEQMDIVLFAGVLIFPGPIAAVINLPILACYFGIGLPVFGYVLFFRMNRRRGYLGHWLRFHLRRRVWRFQYGRSDSLADLRARCIGAWRSEVAGDQHRTRPVWLGPGLAPRWNLAEDATRKNPFLAKVKTGQAAVLTASK